ncbi:MAG: anaerobic ribonucleoside-triphosphate reductase activating protein, partial [Candidatus Magasanikbacteria bacterium CG10_big_fil_rev_8_21_14_0_10_38_6]
MVISGVQPFTLLDFPEKTACIIFTAGCNFRCGYCHNPEFVLPEKIQQIKTSFIDEETIYSFLQKRKGLLDGVVISGGEPTMMGDLPAFIRNIKELGFLVKLDTNGNRPLVLQHLLDEGLLDYVAMDVKTSLVNYADLVGDCVRL